MRNRPVPQIPEHDREFIRSLLIYEDEALLAFNKPSGLPSQVRGNRARNLDHLLWAFARSNGKRPRLVHRLDSGTSGLILAANTRPDAVSLSGQFETKTVQKSYLALVRSGALEGDTGTVDAPVARIEEDGRSRIVAGHPLGKQAETRWHRLVVGDGADLVLARPLTGRMHQIRVHMAHIGAPILGDAIYGGAPASRLALHALSLSFQHPRSGDETRLSAPVTEDFRDVAEQYGLSPAVFDAPGLP